MRKLLYLIIILILPFISSLKITEVELNPSGTDAGNEWVEFYSEEEINLEDYRLVNNDGDEINLDKSFEGYYVYIFSTQWLDNKDEKVFLYKGDELIDKTKILKDEDNDNYAWSFCSGWEFIESSKEEKNNCAKKVIKEDTEIKEEIIEEEIEEGTNNEKKDMEMIILTAQTIKSQDNKENKSNYAMYGFAGFCVLLGILFILKRKKYKNEFR